MDRWEKYYNAALDTYMDLGHDWFTAESLAVAEADEMLANEDFAVETYPIFEDEDENDEWEIKKRAIRQ